jgi:hypothetical protein
VKALGQKAVDFEGQWSFLMLDISGEVEGIWAVTLKSWGWPDQLPQQETLNCGDSGR